MYKNGGKMKRRTKKIYEPDFEPKGHLYMTPDGKIIPSVTGVIKYELGIFQFSSQDAAKRGEFVHRACQLYDEKRLKIESLDPVIKPFFDQYLLFLEENPNFKIIENEIKRYHHKYLFAGRVDKLAEYCGQPAIIDLKTSDKIHIEIWHKWQTAAYEAMFQHERGKQRRFVLYLSPNDYFIQEHTDKRDFYEFLALLSAHNIKINHGYRKQKEIIE